MGISKTFQKVRVTAGYVFTIVFLLFCRPTLNLLLIGLGVAIVGLLIRAWACGHLRKGAELDVSGPYGYTRNPLYFGSFLITVGFGIASGIWWLALLAVIFFAVIYWPVINIETVELEQVIGDDYREFAANVPVFVPRLTAWKKSGRKFDFQLYLKNREFNAAIGVLVAACLLVIKALYLGSI
jgi:protein-S-isoprenylcysteine O-methyltransferase Ste14